MGEKEGNNGDEKKKNNGGERIEFRLLINKKERFKGSIEGSFEGSFEGVEYMKVDCVHNKLRAKVDLGKPREKKVDGKLQKKADGKKPTDKEKEGNNGDKKKNNNGGERIEFRLLINKKERFKGSIEGSFEGSFEGVEYMKVDCVHNKLRVKVDLGKPREKKKVDGKPQKKADGKKPKERSVTIAVIMLDLKKKLK
ncbi:hypothetical protein CsSME_00040668 [Camellia sinensis var. sinensis]